MGLYSLAVIEPPLRPGFCSVDPVRAQTRVPVALIVIAIAIILGVVAAIGSNWLVVATMVLAILGQLVSLRLNRRHVRGRRAD